MIKSKRYVLFCVCVLFFLLAHFIHGQQVLTKFDHLSIEEGLSQSAVFCIMQDKTGFIWVGSEDGLNRFDGYSFLVKKNDPSDSSSISGNTIFSIFEDSKGLIWVGTEGNGLNIYNPLSDSFKRIKHEQGNTNSLSNDIVRAICEDKDGNIWIGTASGLNKYDPVKGIFKKYYHNPADNQSLSHNFILSLFYDSRGILWVGTDNGLNKYNPAGDNFFKYYHSSSNNNSLYGNSVLSFAEDSNGSLWIGTYDGINKMNVKSGTFTRYTPDDGEIKDIRSLCFDANNLWIGSRPDGLLKLNTTTGKFERYLHVKDESTGISRSSVYSIYKDKAGALWIGTWGGGVNVLHKNAQNFKHYKSLSDDEYEISSNDIRALYKENDSIIWVGTRNDGLNKYNRRSGKAVRYLHNPVDAKSISHNTIFSIFKDSNTLWIGTRDGLNKFNYKAGTFTKYFSQFRSDGEEGIIKICKTKSGLFWLGTRGRGILVFDPVENKFIKNYTVDTSGSGLSSSFAYDILEDKQGKIWIATTNGLNRYDPVKKRFVYFFSNEADPLSIGSNVIWSIHEDKQDNLWFGTRGGLSLYNIETKKFRTFTEKDGLPNQVVYSILEDDNGYLWLSTNNGISRFNKNKFLKEGKILFYNYTVSDGIQSPEFNFGAYYRSRDGELFFGGINGFNSFYPAEIKTNNYIPPVVITDLVVMNRSLPVKKVTQDGISLDTAMIYKKEVSLSYKDNIFTFAFTALNYFAPDKNKYKYRLIGFNDKWETAGAGQRSVTYTNLDPGEYIFQVKASNNDGVWNPVPAEVLISISPPFWGTVYFRAGAALALSAVVLFFFYMRIKKYNEEKIKQENFSRQLIEKQESERKRIAAELHDSLGQNLLLIKNRAVLGLQLTNGNTEIAEHVSEISSIASETLKEVREISHNLRPYQLDRLGLSDAVKGAVKKVSESSNINFDLQCDNIDNVLSKEKEINIYRILQEALNNIIKHSDAANARLSFAIINKELVITISDDGRGFNNNIDTTPGGFGLAGIQERVRILNGKMLVNSAPGEGVQLTILIPVDK